MANSPPYRVFTDKYDAVITAEHIDDLAGIGNQDEWLKAARRYDETAGSWRGAATLSALRVLDEIHGDTGPEVFGNSVVSMLVDHSGSLRGEKAAMACAVVETMADCLSRLGVAHEILGFTTSSWKGGQARVDWLEAGKPRNPGRLCDLLHIIYKSADSRKPGAPWSVRNLLRQGLLKENIDGEAILWAANRLRGRPEDRMIIVVISDGAPVDDSTLSVNNPTILFDHLKLVVSEIGSEPGFRLAGVGVHYDVSDCYPSHLKVASFDDLGRNLPEFVCRILMPD